MREPRIPAVVHRLAEAFKAEQLDLFGGPPTPVGKQRRRTQPAAQGRGLHLETVQVGGPHPHQQGVWKRWHSAADGAQGEGLRILSLFSGAGGLDLGLHRALPRARTVGYCEIDPYAQQVLHKRFPGVPIYPDVRPLAERAKDEGVEGRPNMIVGGFPCQDLSRARGAGAKGLEGERSGLYKEMRDLVERCDPDWVVFENVPPLRSRGLDVVLADMQALGREVSWDSVSGASVGAPHIRDRVIVVAHRPGVHLEWTRPDRQRLRGHWQSEHPKIDAEVMVFARDLGIHMDPPVGLPPKKAAASAKRLEAAAYKIARRTMIARTAAAGNAVIPQVAEHVGSLIARSRPGQAPPTGKAIATWQNGNWLDKKGRPVTALPRAGLMRNGTIYQNAHTPDGNRVFRPGDKVWIRNPDPLRGESIYSAHERELIHHLLGRGVQAVPRHLVEAVNPLKAAGIIDDLGNGQAQLTDWGALTAQNVEPTSYSGEGGVNDAFVGTIYGVDGGDDAQWHAGEGGAPFDVVLPDGNIEPFDPEMLNHFPTVAKSDWKGGFAAGGGNTPQSDWGHDARLRGRQLRHWVDGKVNPAFAEWLMGFPKGHLDAGLAPDDYDPVGGHEEPT